MKTKLLLTGIFFLFLTNSYGCYSLKSAIFQEKLPTIAHVHVGHTITSWKTTPDKKGLLIVAQEEAEIALKESKKASVKTGELMFIKEHIRYAMNAIDPYNYKKGPSLGYGLKRALSESANHISFAAESEDASQNIKNFAPQYAAATEDIISRCDLVLSLGKEVLDTPSITEAVALSSEIVNLLHTIVDGNHGKNSKRVDEYGIKNLREQLAATLKNEDPPYRPVAQRYLLGIIRLPNGKWAFSKLIDSFYDTPSSGSSSGGGGWSGGSY